MYPAVGSLSKWRDTKLLENVYAVYEAQKLIITKKRKVNILLRLSAPKRPRGSKPLKLIPDPIP